LRSAPFLPFTIRLMDGEVFEIKEPASLALSPDGEEMVLYGDDRVHRVLVNEIKSMDVHPLD